MWGVMTHGAAFALGAIVGAWLMALLATAKRADQQDEQFIRDWHAREQRSLER